MPTSKGKISFLFEADGGVPRVELLINPNAPLAEVLDVFGIFLISAGYDFDGVVDIVPNDFDGGLDVSEN